MTDATALRSRIVGSADVPPAELVPNERNWRTHPKGQTDALEAALEEVGWVQQVIVNRTSGRLVDGHARVELALRRGEATVPVVYVELDDDEERLVLATLDPIGDLADRSHGRLEALLDGITVDDERLTRMLTDLRPQFPVTGKTHPDEVPEPAAVPSVKPGELWALGNHRILCGDSTDPDHVARLMAGERYALLETDPPYGVDYAEIVDGRKNQKRGGWADIVGDGQAEGAPALAGRVFATSRPHAASNAALFCWSPNGRNWPDFITELAAQGVHFFRQIVWVKPSLVFGRHEYHWQHESAMYGWWDGSRAQFYGERNQTTIWHVDYAPGVRVRNGPTQLAGLGLHPTQKPVELYTTPIRNHTLPGEILYEPFSGSGSGIIAAEQEHRRCFAIDIEPRYVQVAIERWEQFTGRQAEQIDG